MNTFVKAAFIVLSSSLSCAWSQPSPYSEAQPTVKEIAVGFKNYQRITTDVVFVNPELAMLCRGASRAEVEAARAKLGPHAHTGILIYMNRLAADAFATNAGSFPVGSVIVKKKTFLGHRDREADTGVGGMVKRPVGYDSEHGDWEYFYFENPAKIESGQISTCVQCHSSAKDKDHVFGTWRNAKD